MACPGLFRLFGSRALSAIQKSTFKQGRFISTSPYFYSSGNSNDSWKVHGNKTKLVVFDKDGTLVCYHSLWIPWVRTLSKRLEDATRKKLSEKIFKTLGICNVTDRVLPGLLAERTLNETKNALINLLSNEGVHYLEAKTTLENVWKSMDPSDPKHFQPLSDLTTLFKTLHDYNIKIAICTEDHRRGTISALRELGISQYVDKVVCGDDKTSMSKPSPHNLYMICDALFVDPTEAAIVGDRKVDMSMGMSAEFGLRIGVLTGVGNNEDLAPYSDHVVSTVKDIIPYVLPVMNEKKPVKVEVKPVDKKKWELVIFDKDGTLICFHSMWTPFAMEYARKVSHESRLNVSDKVLDALGVCTLTETCKPGVYAEGTHQQINDCMLQLLINEGLSNEEATKILRSVDSGKVNIDPIHKPNLKSIGNIVDLFKTLKRNGIKIAVCTADNRNRTINTLNKLDVMPYIDKIVCGDDEGTQPKPMPHNALMICEELGVDPKNAIMIGDSKADVGMGKAANLGASIGVLTGVTTESELSKIADYVFPSILELVDFIQPEKTGSENGNDDDDDGDSTPSNQSGRNGSVKRIASRAFSTDCRNSPKRSFSTSCRSNTSARPAIAEPKEEISMPYIKSHDSSLPVYSHIIVGAGSAGCVLANRLSAVENNKVLSLEAGPKDNAWTIHMPAALMYNLCHDKYNWFYHTIPQKHMDNRVMYWPRGRVWGGSSALNAMVYIRGHAYDYDLWEKLGAEGWSYADCLPYFRKAQTHENGPDDYRGGNGPLHVSRGKSDNPLFQAFIDAGVQAGYPYTEDMNGYQQEGFGWMDMTIHRGQRWSAAMAYLRPVSYRNNLSTENGVLANRIIFDETRAIGIEYIQNKEVKRVYGDEIILAGGSINSPQLLMLSGIGDADHLQEYGIPLVAHSPGVGQNLQDHLEVYVQQECRKPITLYTAQWKFPHNMIRIGLEYFTQKTGDGASAHLEAGGFIRSRPGVEHPDIQYHFLPSVVLDHGRKVGETHAYQVHVGSLRATSRGSLKLASTNPKDHPIIDANYMATDIDRWEARQWVRLSSEIFEQKAFDEFRGKTLTPVTNLSSDDEIDAFIRRMADSAYHPSCTCKMGSTRDPMAVVDSKTNVIGVEGLRVVDASIMPHIVSGNLNGPTIMLAEKAADIILGKKPLPKSTAPVFKPKSLELQR